MEQWKRRFMLCVGIVLCAMFVTGARQVGFDLYRRPARLEQAREIQRRWSQDLAHEMTGRRNGGGWAKIARDAPELMLQACASRPMANR